MEQPIAESKTNITCVLFSLPREICVSSLVVLEIGNYRMIVEHERVDHAAVTPGLASYHEMNIVLEAYEQDRFGKQRWLPIDSVGSPHTVGALCSQVMNAVIQRWIGGIAPPSAVRDTIDGDFACIIDLGVIDPLLVP